MRILILIAYKNLSYHDKMKISSLFINNKIYYIDFDRPKLNNDGPKNLIFKFILALEFFLYKLYKNTFSFSNFNLIRKAKNYYENKTEIDLVYNINIDDATAIKIKNEIKSILFCHKKIDLENKKYTDFFMETIFKKPTIKASFFLSGKNKKELYHFQSIEIPSSSLSIMNLIRLEQAINDLLESFFKKLLTNKINNEKTFLEDEIGFHKYTFKDVMYYLKNIFLNVLLIKFKKTEHFKVGYLTKKNFLNKNFDKISFLTPPKGKYFADPFIIEYKNRKIIFHEEYSDTEKGKITATEISKGENKYLGTVLEEKFHLSFPHIFLYKEQYYMIPESNADNSIKLYKCMNFPTRWEFQYNLIPDINCADTIIVFKNGYYWMITSKLLGGYHSNYNIYYSNSPISKTWKEHKLNPIKIRHDSRNGGLIYFENEIILVNQFYDFLDYGDHVNYKILNKISSNDYEENDFKFKNDKFFEEGHHVSNSNSLIVFDKKFIP